MPTDIERANDSRKLIVVRASNIVPCLLRGLPDLDSISDLEQENLHGRDA
jgi:hypothetical protein